MSVNVYTLITVLINAIQNLPLYSDPASEICDGTSYKVPASAGKTIEGNLAATKFIIVQCRAGCCIVSWQLVVIINYFVTVS